MLSPYRKHSVDLNRSSIEWFLHDGHIDLEWVKKNYPLITMSAEPVQILCRT